MPAAKRSTARVILLGALSAACIGTGALPYGATVARWFRDGLDYHGMEGLEWLGGLAGAVLILAGLLLAGIVLRLSGWALSHRASLWLSIACGFFLIATFAIFIQSGFYRAHGGTPLLTGVVAGGLILVALPPFLHWFFARSQPKDAGN